MTVKTPILWSSTIGDLVFGSAEAGAVGASFGNGAAQFGQNPANPNQMGDDGNIAVDLPTPLTGRSPSATGADRILSLMTIPAQAFDIALRGVSILAAGNCPNTNAKTFKIILNPTTPTLGAVVSGGTTIATFTAIGAGTQGGWQVMANLYKYGAAGSNTQLAIHEAAQVGNVVGTLSAPSLATLPENAPITVAITGNATTAGTDIVFNFGQIFAMN